MGSDVLPCYVVCDVSLSMTDHLAELNAGLREFHGAVHADSAVAGLVRCCVVGFAGTPKVLRPLYEMATLVAPNRTSGERDATQPPARAELGGASQRDQHIEFRGGGTATPPELPEMGRGTNFGPAFTLLREAIDRDVRGLKAQRVGVHRPIVFFLSDGQPTDPVTWPAAYAALTDPAWTARPHMIAFGVGDADQDTLCRIGTFRTFLGRDGVRMSTALIATVTLARPRSDRV
jgi:uncharacterized protein YegL